MKEKVNVLTNSPVVEIRKNEVDVVNPLGARTTIRADSIVLSVGRRPKLDKSLVDTAKEVAREVKIIGDAKSPRKIIDAIREGFWTAVDI